ncbi:MAG: hypothetical protein Q8R70_09310, partial [Methanoregula sp.]|nr:hypothetical protein [Methanoregula sp.]
MVTYIGDVPVQAIEEFSPDNSSKTQNVYKGMFRRPIVRAGSNEAEPFDLTGTTYAEGTKNEDDFIEDLKGLIREAAYNRINLGNRVGFLAVKDVKSKKTAELANMREYSMSGYFQPAAQYEASVRIETEAFADEWAKGIVPVIPLPVGATNVRVKSPWGSVTLPNPSGSMTGADGAVPVYQPFPVFDWRTYGCALAGATPAAAVFDAAVYAGKKITLTHFADETITWSFVVGKDVPQGKYKIGFRVEDGASAGAFTVTVTGSTTGAILTAEAHTTVASAGAWEQIQTAELSLLTSETITVVVAKATNDNVFSVNYGYLIPQNTCRVTFDAANEYNTGECKVYDTVTTGAAIASWKRVYNETHIFSGDIVVQNSFLRWTIKQATAWSTATTLTELVSNTTGTLYPIAFGTDLTDLVIDKILPNCIVLKARMDVGAAATYDSLNDVETAEIYITPAAFYFDLSRIGSFRYDWHCSLSSALYGRGSAFVDKAGAEGVQSSPYYMLGVAGAVLGMEKCTTDNANVGGTVLDTASTAVSEAGDYALSLFMVPVALNYSGSGFTISQDNNGVERKFFKDNFSNNTSAAYTTISGWVWDTANKRLYNRSANTGYMTRVVSAGYGVFSSVITHQDTTAGTYTYF